MTSARSLVAIAAIAATSFVACIDLDAPTACSEDAVACVDLGNADFGGFDAVGDGGDTQATTDSSTDAAARTDAGDACSGECKPGDFETLSGACPAVLEKKRRVCAADCTWRAPTCEMPKGWTSIEPAPASFKARDYYSAIWTGSELLIWGGSDAGSPLDDGLRWELKTNTWKAIPAAPAAFQPHQLHAAVWTGATMIVWGGSAPSSSTEAATFDPVSNVWKVYSKAPVIERHEMAAAWMPSSGELFVWGGEDRNDGATFRALGDLWTALPTSPLSGRERMVTSTIGSDVLVWGGSVGDFTALSDGARFSSGSRTWTKLPAPPTTYVARLSAATASLPTGFITWGGITPAPASLGDGAVFADDKWTLVPEPTAAAMSPSKRASSAAWCNSEHTCWFWSGASIGVDGTPIQYLGGAAYDVSTSTWTPMTSTGQPPPRQSSFSFWTGRSGLVFGGLDATLVSRSDGALYTP